MDKGSLHNIMDHMMKYAMFVCSLEAFSLDSSIDHDVIFDGYNSNMNNIRIRFRVG